MKVSYEPLIVESFISGGGRLEDAVHIRPIADQKFPLTMRVECSRRMTDTSVYPLGTRFKIMVRIKPKLNCAPHLYSFHGDEIIPIAGLPETLSGK